MASIVPFRDGEPFRAGEAHRGFIDVDALESPPGLPCRGEECTDIAADLEPRARRAVHSCQTARLRAVGRPLRAVKSLEHLRLESFLRFVDLTQLALALLRVTVDQSARSAAHDAHGRTLGERGSVE